MQEKTPWWNHPWLLAMVPAVVVAVIFWPKGQESMALAAAGDVVGALKSSTTRVVSMAAWVFALSIVGPLALGWIVGRLTSRPDDNSAPLVRGDGHVVLSDDEERIMLVLGVNYEKGWLREDALGRVTGLGQLAADAAIDRLWHIDFVLRMGENIKLDAKGRRWLLDTGKLAAFKKEIGQDE